MRNPVRSSGCLLIALATLAGCGTPTPPPPPPPGDTDGGTPTDAGTNTGGTARLIQSGKEVASGGSYFIPLNNGTSTVALFSEQREAFTFKNDSSSAVTIQSMSVTVAAGVAAEEYSLQSNAITPTPLAISNLKLDPGALLDFYVRFYPVASGTRAATLKIVTDGGEYTVSLTGKGQTDAVFFTQGTLAWEKVFGGKSSDELITGLVGDAQGNVYFTANFVPGMNDDLLIGKVKSDGTLAWAKSYDGKYKSVSKDPGQNAESGGSSNALSLDSDGNLYVAASVAGVSQNNTYFAVILKINPSTGALLWQKSFGNGATITLTNQNAEAYSVDASGPYVLVAGTTGAASQNAESLVLFYALQKADGALFSKKAFEIFPTVNERGYVVRRDGKGGAYIGGNGGTAPATAFLMKIDAAETATPALAWVKQVGLGTGGNINAIDVDSDGNAYVALDRRGATTYFSAAKFDGNGAVSWSKTYGGGNGDRNNIHVVKVVGADVYLAGRIGLPNFDGAQGDGLVAKLSTATGAMAWSTFHFSGKGPDELAEHRVKGVVLVGNDLYIATQVYTGNMNGVRYSGYWYDGLGTVEDFAVPVTAVNGSVEVPLAKATLLDATTALGNWVDAPATLTLRDAVAKKDGQPPDSDLMLSKITLK